MAPLPQNSTNRLWLDYTCLGVPHVAMFRPAQDLFGSDIQSFAISIANWLQTAMFSTDSVYGARYSELGSTFSIPISFAPVEGDVTAGGNSWVEDPKSTFITIPVRGGAGEKLGRFCFFTAYRWGGNELSWPPDNRYNAGERAAVDTFIETFVDICNGVAPYLSGLVAIDGTTATPFNYMNIRKNGYTETKRRKTG